MGKFYNNPGVTQTEYMGVSIAAPLDNRVVVKYRSDLLNENTWIYNGAKRTYSGMIVGVVSDGSNNGAYMLVKSAKFDKQSWDSSLSNYDQEGWMKISGGSSITPAPAQIYMDQSMENEDTYPGSFGGSGTQNDPYWIESVNGGNF